MDGSSPLTRRKFLVRAGISIGGATVAGGGLVAYARGVEPGWLDVVHVPLTLPRLGAAFDGYRIAQISDIHMDSWMTPQRLSSVVQSVNAQHPDLIAVTGDFVTDNAHYFAPHLVAGLSKLSAPDGVIAILGNHDYWTDPTVIRDVIHDSGMRELTNRSHTLVRGHDPLHLAGMDDIWSGHPQLDAVAARLPAEGAAILLAHEPDFADASAENGRFDLQISGHSHGGQVRIPLFGPVHTVRFGRKYVAGRYQVRDMIQYTNRGVGLLAPHVRFACRPEITVFTLHAPPQ